MSRRIREVVSDGESAKLSKAVEQKFYEDMKMRRRGKGGDNDPFLNPRSPNFLTEAEKKRIADEEKARAPPPAPEQKIDDEAGADEKKSKKKLKGADEEVERAVEEDPIEAGGDFDLERAHAEAINKVPWTYKYLKFDQMNSVSPFHSMQYYYMKHTTGPSLVYLMITIIALTLYTALIYDRWTNQKMTEITFSESLTNEEAQLPVSETFVLAGFIFLPASTATTISDYAKFSYQRCSYDDSAGVTTCATLPLGTCSINTVPNLLCIQTPDVLLTGTSYIEFRMTACPSCSNKTQSEIEAVLTGGQIQFYAQTNKEIEIGLDQIVSVPYTNSFRWNYMSGQANLVELNYIYSDVKARGRFIIDSDFFQFVKFSHFNAMQRSRDTASGSDQIFFTGRLKLFPYKQTITLIKTSLVDVVGQIAAFLLFVKMVGMVFHAYNRWHFRHYGMFRKAGLPSVFHDQLFANQRKNSVFALDDVKRYGDKYWGEDGEDPSAIMHDIDALRGSVSGKPHQD